MQALHAQLSMVRFKLAGEATGLTNAKEEQIPLEVIAQVHLRHASAISRLQLLTELATLGTTAILFRHLAGWEDVSV